VRGNPARSVLRGPRRSNAPGLPGELVGEFSNGGAEYHPKGEPTRTKTHDFVDKELGRAVPYGVYDRANDEGWVSVGDTAAAAHLVGPNLPIVTRKARSDGGLNVWSAGINRHGERNERVPHRRSSEPRWPRVMRRRP